MGKTFKDYEDNLKLLKRIRYNRKKGKKFKNSWKRQNWKEELEEQKETDDSL